MAGAEVMEGAGAEVMEGAGAEVMEGAGAEVMEVFVFSITCTPCSLLPTPFHHLMLRWIG